MNPAHERMVAYWLAPLGPAAGDGVEIGAFQGFRVSARVRKTWRDRLPATWRTARVRSGRHPGLLAEARRLRH